MMGGMILSTLGQIGFLFLLIAAGWVVAKFGSLPKGAAAVLAKLENAVFIPALVLSTFMNYFTPAKITSAWKTLLAGTITLAVTVPLALLIARLCTKEDSVRKLYAYGLSFSNFGFMGNVVVSILFPDYFGDYLVFTLPFWILIYLWGVPALLIPGGNKDFGSRFRAMLNPMFFGMVIGIVLGLTGFGLPEFLRSAISVAGDCVSPIAMLLVGITVAGIDLGDAFGHLSVYLISLIRLFVLPILAIGALYFIPCPHAVEVCIVAVLAMPLGLNTIVVPSAYGKNTTVAASMSLISHLLSIATIPIVFWLMQKIL